MSRFHGLAFILWACLVLRVLYDKSFAPDRTPAPLRVPLSEFPMDALGPEWKGEDIPLDAEVEKASGVTSYVQRLYRQSGKTLWFYVGYVSGRAPDSLHHPGVCFPGSGLALERDEVVTIPMPGLEKECRFKEFFWRNPAGGGTYTLSTFYYRGKFEPEEWRLRSERILGIRYFAVITISGTPGSSLEDTRDVYEDALQRAIPKLVPHFPD